MMVHQFPLSVPDITVLISRQIDSKFDSNLIFTWGLLWNLITYCVTKVFYHSVIY